MKTGIFYIVNIILTLGLVLTYFIFKEFKTSKKKNQSSYFIKYVPLFAFGLALATVFITYYSYTQKVEIETQGLELLMAKKQDSIAFTNATKARVIDSLNAYSLQLGGYITNLQEHQKIAGINGDVVSKANNQLTVTMNQIASFQKYNDVISIKKYNDLFIDSIFIKKAAYATSGISSNFIFKCPENTESTFLDLEMRFIDESLVDKVELIYITQRKWLNASNALQLFAQTYKPQHGPNLFRITNYLNQDSTDLEIGYFLKSEMNKNTPFFEQKSCKSSRYPAGY